MIEPALLRSSENCSDVVVGMRLSILPTPHQMGTLNKMHYLWKVDVNLFGRQKNMRGGQGDAPLGMPPPLGERGGYPHAFFK